MKKSVFYWGIGLVFIILLTSLNSADVSFVNKNVKTNYYTGEEISGSVTITLKDEPISSKVKTNFGGNLTLIEFLEANELYEGDFNCSSPGCASGYETDQEITSAVSLGNNGTKYIGFKLTGEEVILNNLKFRISSNEGPTCYNQIMVDVLNSEELLIPNYNTGSQSCSQKYQGCFDSGLSSDKYTSVELGDDRYCEKIKMPVSGAFELGAIVEKIASSDQEDLVMEIFDEDANFIESCFLPQITQNKQEVSCTIDLPIYQEKDYLVCLSKQFTDNRYKIRAEQSGQKCGTRNIDSDNFNVDYEIFAKIKQFNSVNININDSIMEEFYSGETLVDYINYYLDDVYAGHCSGNGCIIPFRINGNLNQFTVSGVEAVYDTDIGLKTTNKIYLLEEEEATISVKNLTVDLDLGNFIIPINSNENRLTFSIGGEEVFRQNINLTKSIDFDVYPKVVLLGVETKFKINVVDNLTYSSWDFGDGETEEVNGKEISHRYTESGEYDLYVEMQRRDGKIGKKTFKIVVGNANESAKYLLNLYQSRLNNLSSSINSYSTSIANEIKKNIDVNQINLTLNRSKYYYGLAKNNSDYENIVGELIELDVPIRFFDSNTGNLPLIALSENIDVSYILEISGKESRLDEEKVIADINTWTQNNYEANINYRQIGALSDSGQENVLLNSKITLTSKGSPNPSYLIIDYPLEEIIFAGVYGEKTINGATYIPITGSKEIEFIINEDISVQDLGIYLSPEVDLLGGTYEQIEFVDKEEFKTTWFIILISGLFLFTLIVYIILQEWYKRNYEIYLFKNKDDLYNIINFIYNSRSSGLRDGEIKAKLSKAKWTGEQITYAFRKLEGKRTGMWEIPIFKGSENKKVREEIAKRQEGGKIDARFIKTGQY